jgi:antitoxin component YwqK of YwqJK toxin-antitoxin module
MRKILVIFIILSSVALAQNDGLVKANYPSGALQTEGNYANGVRDGLWTFWYEGEVYQDYGEDDEPNTQDEGESNGVWDSTETVILDIDGDTFYDPPQKKMEGSYSVGNREGLWTTWYINGNRKEESNYVGGKLDGSIYRWNDSGNKTEGGTYEAGKQTGIWIWYYNTGIKKEQTQFHDGQQEGLWLQWDCVCSFLIPVL